MFNSDLVNFFKRHNLYEDKMFDYFNNNITHYDYNIWEYRILTGCLFISSEDDILKKIHLCVPTIIDDITMLINVHEYTHAIEMYNNLEKIYKESIYREVLPITFERLYVMESSSMSLEDYREYLDNNVKRNKDEYIIGSMIADELINNLNNDNISNLKRKVRTIGRKYEK